MGKQLYREWLGTARKQASRTAIREADGTEISFKDLHEKVEARLVELAGNAHWQNKTVGLQFENSADWLVAFLTCQALGAIALPFDPDVPEEGIRAVIENLRVAVLWTHEGMEEMAKPVRRAPACLVKLTSGSTGLPRPLFFNDAQMLADGKQVTVTMGIRTEDVNLALIPFGHSYGLGNLVLPLIQSGVPVAVCHEPFPHSIVRALNVSGATVVPAVPAILKALAHSGISRKDLRGVRLWISAGSPLAPVEAQHFLKVFGSRIHNFYGSSETGGIAFDRTGEDTLSGRSVGTPLEGVRIEATPTGRLKVASPAVFTRGNRRRRGRRGSHVLADVGALQEDGAIALRGRRSRMVKLAGKRVNLGEIECQLLRVRGIREARAVDYVTSAGRTRLAAAIAPIQPKRSVREALKKQLPLWKIPDRWLLLAKFPLSSRGKVNFKELDRKLRSPINFPDKP